MLKKITAESSGLHPVVSLRWWKALWSDGKSFQEQQVIFADSPFELENQWFACCGPWDFQMTLFCPCQEGRIRWPQCNHLKLSVWCPKSCCEIVSYILQPEYLLRVFWKEGKVQSRGGWCNVEFWFCEHLHYIGSSHKQKQPLTL